MSQLHNYINPAFCQQSEFYGSPASAAASPAASQQQRSLNQQYPMHQQSLRQPPRQTTSNNGNGNGNARVHRSTSMRSMNHASRAKYQAQHNQTISAASNINNNAASPRIGPKPAQTNLSARYEAAAANFGGAGSRHQQINNNHQQQHPQPATVEGFALVPLSELPARAQLGSRYAFVPAHEAQAMARSVSHRRLARSQDDLDRYAHEVVHDSSFTSLPPQMSVGSSTSTPTKQPPVQTQPTRQHQQLQHQLPRHQLPQPLQPQMHTSTRHNSAASVFNRSANTSTTTVNTSLNSSASGATNGRLKPAFSTDFVGNKSLVLVDQNSQQRYDIVPTAEDEELVDANEEIIQVHNGRRHRYAVIPQSPSDDEPYEDEEDDDTGVAEHAITANSDADEAETCLSSGDFAMSPTSDKYATIKCAPPGYHQSQLSLHHAHQQQLQQQLHQQQQIIAAQQQQLQQMQQAQAQQAAATVQIHHQRTPSKPQQAAATQKLFEILSTPRKPSTIQPAHPTAVFYSNGGGAAAPVMRIPNQLQQAPPPTPVQQQQPHYETPTRLRDQQNQQKPQLNVARHQHQNAVHTSTPKDFTPQKLYYDRPPAAQQHQQHQTPQKSGDQRRTTAVVTPRLARQNRTQKSGRSFDDVDLEAADYDDEEDEDYDADSLADGKSAVTNMSTKLRRATATIGAVSLMLMMSGAMNAALSGYMISLFGRLYYLDLGILTGLAALSLGALGFKSRHSEWLPNRNYVSGFGLVTLFALLNCCALLVLLARRPAAGTPLHDVTTGVLLAVSTLQLLVISLGVVTSRWCRGPPPDNRVEVYNASGNRSGGDGGHRTTRPTRSY